MVSFRRRFWLIVLPMRRLPGGLELGTSETWLRPAKQSCSLSENNHKLTYLKDIFSTIVVYAKPFLSAWPLPARSFWTDPEGIEALPPPLGPQRGKKAIFSAFQARAKTQIPSSNVLREDCYGFSPFLREIRPPERA